MKVWIIKEEFERFKEMASEGRTRELTISSFRRFEDDREIEIELKDE